MELRKKIMVGLRGINVLAALMASAAVVHNTARDAGRFNGNAYLGPISGTAGVNKYADVGGSKRPTNRRKVVGTSIGLLVARQLHPLASQMDTKNARNARRMRAANKALVAKYGSHSAAKRRIAGGY